MIWKEELIERCAARRRLRLGHMSDAAFNELLLAVRENPDTFVDDPAERAFALLARAMAKFDESAEDDDLLDDDQYMAARAKRFSALTEACDAALAVDPDSLDAQLLRVLAQGLEPDPLLDALLELEQRFGGEASGGEIALKPFAELSWENVFDRPRLRLRAAVARTCADGARWKMALEACESVLSATEKHGDPLGARYTEALALCRLEDEEGLNALDARFSALGGNTWTNLARCILLYKLDRLPAAKRALRGYARLCDGAAYALLRPIYVEIYLPDRPAKAHAGTFEEALCAVREAEPIIADTPDFISWCQGQDWFEADAKSYAEAHDYDW